MMIRFNFLHFISEWIDHKDFVIIIAPLEKKSICVSYVISCSNNKTMMLSPFHMHGTHLLICYKSVAALQSY